MKQTILISLIFVLFGCATGAVVLDEVDSSYNHIYAIVKELMPLGIQSQSQNGREFKSEYFVSNQEGFVAAREAPVRQQAHVVVLGDRRPYKIKIRVATEKRAATGKYDHVQYDEGIARVISRRIQKALHKRRDGLNIIDDFRAF